MRAIFFLCIFFFRGIVLGYGVFFFFFGVLVKVVRIK
jgi:hypothetical protein